MREDISREDAVAIVRECQKSPDFFIDEILGFRGTDLEPYEAQRGVLRSLACHDLVGVVAANGAGKSYLMGLACLWFGRSFFPSRVVSTAGTWEQVESKLWLGNIHKVYRRSRTPLGGRLNTLDLTFRDPHSEEVLGYVCARSTKLAEYFEGHHEDYILLVLDEAKSIPQAIVDAADRCRSSGKVVKMLVASTPGSDAGPFYEIIEHGAKLGWKIHTVDAFASPRIRPEWIAEMREKHGQESDFYRSAVLAKFPISKADDVVITRAMLEAAAARQPTQYSADEKDGLPPDPGEDVGVDIADAGDNWTRFVHRRGPYVFRAYGYQGHDTMHTADRIVELIRSGIDPRRIRIDFVGIGKGTYDRLRQLGHPVTGVNFGWASTTRGKRSEQQFANIGAELWWLARRKLLGEPGVGQPLALAPEVEREISGDCVGRKWRRKEDGSIVLESKDDMKARGLSSPDYADALALSLAPVRMDAAVVFPKPKPPQTTFSRPGRNVFAGAGPM